MSGTRFTDEFKVTRWRKWSIEVMQSARSLNVGDQHKVALHMEGTTFQTHERSQD